MKHPHSIMIQGTASGSGKSLVATAFCRILCQDCYTVSPFKAQNISNNSFVTADGLEMGRAQVVQAKAARLAPDVRMNPVLIKPSANGSSQVVLHGKPSFIMDAVQWINSKERLRTAIKTSYDSLAAQNQVMVLEGAGSPAEINLKQNDLVNMGMAAMADAPVLLVGDIDCGGVFASLVGTMQLLDKEERARVKGFIINKFRGDVELLKPGLNQLEQLTRVPVLGVIPWIDHSIDDEDGVTSRFSQPAPKKREVDICVIRLPHISNFTDLLPLESIGSVSVRWCDNANSIGTPDVIIIPGTKTTIADLQALKESGIAQAIVSFARRGGVVLGICGGFQMLGTWIHDPCHLESDIDHETGLGLLDITTTFQNKKMTIQTSALLCSKDVLLFDALDGVTCNGYEIHMGQSDFGPQTRPFTRSQQKDDSFMSSGVADISGRVMGTYLHGLFDSGMVCTGFINALRAQKGLDLLETKAIDREQALDVEIDRLAATVRSALDLDRIYRIIGINKS